MIEIKAGSYALHMLKFLPKIKLSMLINVMLIKKHVQRCCLPQLR